MAALLSPTNRTVAFLPCVAVLLLVCLSGCESTDERGLPVFPVSGEVLLSGKPAENALVVFHPLSELPGSLRPSGRTGADGKFSLSTYESGDGAPAGAYRVTIVLPKAAAGPAPDPDLAGDRLQGRYADPATSQLRAQVEEKENVLPPFVVK